MSNIQKIGNPARQSNNLLFQRRSLLKTLSLAALLPVGLGAYPSGIVIAADGVPLPENVMTPDAALKRLLDGNKRYVSGKISVRDFNVNRAVLAKGQNPYACILSCADSRVAPELCFDESRGDLFVTRLAGNYASLDILASLEYGAAVLKAPLIMVLGHTDCGAIKAGMKADKENVDFPGHIQTITSELKSAVKEGVKLPGNATDNVAKENVRLNVAKLKESTPILRQLVADKKLMVVGGLYHLDTGKVEFLT